MNPSERNGTLSSSTAIGLLNGVRAAECSGTTAALSATSCLLTGLRNFTEYEIVVEVCVVGVGGGDCNYCTNTSSSGHRTSPGVFEPHQLAALGNEIPNSTETVADPLTQISIKVALSTLPIEDVGQVSIVTAYIELASGASSQLPSRGLFRRFARIYLFYYHGVIYFDVAKPDPIPVGLIIGVVVGCLLLLAVVAFVVFWMRRRTVASPDDEKDNQRIDVVYELYPEPQLDRLKM
ncbi:hypothetical protein SprV_0802627900 [Sparganum proliferum]